MAKRTNRPWGRAWAVGAILAGLLGTSPARAAVDFNALRTWGMTTAASIESSLRVSGTFLYSETANLNGTKSGGVSGRSFVWPVSTQFRVLNSLAQINPANKSQLRSFSDAVQNAYFKTGGYDSSVANGDKFYDDNAHMVVALTEAYRLTGDSVYLDRAKATQTFVMSGENTVAGGGIYFQQNVTTSKDTISTLQGARAAAMLYNVTHQASYLTDAQRLATWASSHVQTASGLYAQSWNISSNQPSGVEIVNSAGDAISMNLELYDATLQSSYLTEAQRIASAAVGRYFNGTTGAINDEGYWAYELVDGLDALYLHDKNATWLNKVDGALRYLQLNKQDANGHYGLFWGRDGAVTTPFSSWNLNEQAAVARAYLNTSLVPEPAALAAFTIAGIALVRRRRT